MHKQQYKFVLIQHLGSTVSWQSEFRFREETRLLK